MKYRLTAELLTNNHIQREVLLMKKSEMLKQNTELFDRLTDAELTITALKKEIAERDSRITELKSEIERLNAKLNATEPLKTLEAKVVRQAEVSPEVDYGGHFYHLAQKTPWHDLSGAVHAKRAVKVNLRSGLGIDASVHKDTKED